MPPEAKTLGSIDEIISRAASSAASATQPFVDDIARRVRVSDDHESAIVSIYDALVQDDTAAMVGLSSDELLVGALLGILVVEVDERKQDLAQLAQSLARDAFSALPPREAIDFFRRKKVVSIEEFKRLSDDAKKNAFAMARSTKTYGVVKMHRMLVRSLEEGETLASFKRGLKDRYGSTVGFGKNSAHYLETTYRTNVIGAYNDGAYSRRIKTRKLLPYWRYVTAGDGRVRESHAAMSGRTFRADDPIWDTWHPSNGMNCRCGIEALPDDDGARVYRGSEIKERPDQGFAGSPATAHRVNRQIDRYKRMAADVDGFKPPTPATTGGRAYSTAGQLVIRNHQRAARKVNKLAGLTEREVLQRSIDSAEHVTVPGRLRALKAGQTEFAIPIKSQYLDSSEQLIRRVAQDPIARNTLRSLHVRALSRYVRGVDNADPGSAKLSGIARSIDHEISLIATSAAERNALAEIVQAVESGSESPIRRAQDASNVIIRGVTRGMPGFERAYLVKTQRKAESGEVTDLLLTPDRQSGIISAPIKISARKRETL